MSKKETLDEFVNNLHSSTKLLSKGKAKVGNKEVEAVLVKNLYGQEIVWGMFGHSRGKFKGFLANNANTGRVNYQSDCGKHVITYNPPFGDFDENDPIPPMNWPNQDHLSNLVKAAIESKKK